MEGEVAWAEHRAGAVDSVGAYQEEAVGVERPATPVRLLVAEGLVLQARL